jgi:hypothetical protein
VELLERLETLTGKESHPARIRGRLGSFVVIPDPPMATIFYLLPFVLQNEDLFNACSFFRSCCSEYSLMDGVAGDVLHEPRQEPENESQRLGLESVVLQSFRTIEAVVGEPGNEKRFRARLNAWGMSYDERVGFPGRGKRRLGDRIRWLQYARDSAAAHDKRRRRNPFTMFEAMEAQHLADAVLHLVLRFTAESSGRTGDEAEIAFLLAEMFPDPGNPGWVNDRTRFRGNRSCKLSPCCEAPSDERSAGNLHATFCGSRERATALGHPVGTAPSGIPTAKVWCYSLAATMTAATRTV